MPVSAISCLIPEQGLDEDRVLGRLQFEYVSFPLTGRFFAAGPMVRLIEQGNHDLSSVLARLGVPAEMAKRYEEILEDHHTLIVAGCSTHEQARRIQFLFQSAGGQEIIDSEEWLTQDEPAAFSYA